MHGKCVFDFIRNCKLFSEVEKLFCFPTSNESSNYSASSPALDLFKLYVNATVAVILTLVILTNVVVSLWF